jgi:cardiolipin synthase
MKTLYSKHNARLSLLFSLSLSLLACLLVGCDLNLSGLANTTPGSTNCPASCQPGSGTNNLSVIVEPDAGLAPIVDAISSARKSVWVEMYMLTQKSVINILEEDASRGIDVRVMLEPHPVGSGSVSPRETLDRLSAAGVKAQFTDPQFTLTHEKGMVIDNSTAYIMTSNFTNSALGSGTGMHNREYDIVDTNAQDVQAVADLFQNDWNHSTAQISDANLVVSPVNSRADFTSLIASARKTLIIEAEEMNDTQVEQAIVSAEQRGVRVQVILPEPSGSSDSNHTGIDVIKQAGISVREDPRLYMHAKMMIIDGREAFVGSENISEQSLDQNRELGILISDNGVLNTLQQTFQTDWNVSQAV